VAKARRGRAETRKYIVTPGLRCKAAGISTVISESINYRTIFVTLSLLCLVTFSRWHLLSLSVMGRYCLYKLLPLHRRRRMPARYHLPGGETTVRNR